VADSFDEFPPQITQAVDGLMWLGHLEEEVKFAGHTFILRTLKASEELEAALLAKDYLDTFGQVKGTAWAHLAASIVSVDGDENFCPPIGPDSKQYVRAKFNYMTDNWYWPLGEYLFGHYAELVRRQADAVEAVDSLSSRSLKNSWKLADSLKKQDDSTETQTSSKSDAHAISPEQMKSLADENE